MGVHNCKVSELIFVRYTVNFRCGMVFAETLKRFSDCGLTYKQRLANAYNAYNPGASVMDHQIEIVSIQNGYR